MRAWLAYIAAWTAATMAHHVALEQLLLPALEAHLSTALRVRARCGSP
jgi:hypothetical protein